MSLSLVKSLQYLVCNLNSGIIYMLYLQSKVGCVHYSTVLYTVLHSFVYFDFWASAFAYKNDCSKLLLAWLMSVLIKCNKMSFLIYLFIDWWYDCFIDLLMVLSYLYMIVMIKNIFTGTSTWYI